MHAVMIKGFPTKEEAEMFVDWYCEHGEQDAANWFEVANDGRSGRSPWMSNEPHGTKRILDKKVDSILEMAIVMDE